MNNFICTSMSDTTANGRRLKYGPRNGTGAGNLNSMSGAARLSIQRNGACRSFTLLFSACHSPTKIGSWINPSKQPPSGFTLYFLYSAHVSLVIRSLSSAYFSFSSVIFGCNSCIRLADIACLRLRGNRSIRTVIVRRMIAIP